MKHLNLRKSLLVLALGLSMAFAGVSGATALGSSNPNQSGSTGLQGTISSPAPKTAPTISLPVNGRTFTSTPITVSGLCTNGLLVKVFSNNIFVGSVTCTSGSFSLQVDLLSGQNDIIVRQYDSFDQASPDSNTVTVTFQDAQFAAFGQRVSLTSNYAKLGANVGVELTWPLILSGGSGPYALSIDWGDGSAVDLKSVPFGGEVNINHVFQSSGVYRVVVKATDTSGQSAFLQLVGVGNGKVTQANTSGSTSSNTIVKRVFVWWPFVLLLPSLAITFWLGKRYELQAIHRQIERQTEMYNRDLER
jgi:hypothetical protein